MALDKGEVRVYTDPTTGAQKEINDIRMDLIPAPFLWELGRVFGKGAAKYADHNWRKGYPISKSLAALYRHLARWQDGEDMDELGVNHMAMVGWHAAVIYTLLQDNPALDDRFKREDGSNATE